MVDKELFQLIPRYIYYPEIRIDYWRGWKDENEGCLEDYRNELAEQNYEKRYRYINNKVSLWFDNEYTLNIEILGLCACKNNNFLARVPIKNAKCDKKNATIEFPICKDTTNLCEACAKRFECSDYNSFTEKKELVLKIVFYKEEFEKVIWKKEVREEVKAEVRRELETEVRAEVEASIEKRIEENINNLLMTYIVLDWFGLLKRKKKKRTPKKTSIFTKNYDW